MSANRIRRIATTTAALLAIALVLSACQQTGADPFDAGQLFRQQVDLFLEDAGQFIAGFCSSAALPGVLAVLVIWLRTWRTAG